MIRYFQHFLLSFMPLPSKRNFYKLYKAYRCYVGYVVVVRPLHDQLSTQLVAPFTYLLTRENAFNARSLSGGSRVSFWYCMVL